MHGQHHISIGKRRTKHITKKVNKFPNQSTLLTLIRVNVIDFFNAKFSSYFYVLVSSFYNNSHCQILCHINHWYYVIEDAAGGMFGTFFGKDVVALLILTSKLSR